MLGYNKNLFILPFDHRNSFVKMFGFKSPLNKEQKQSISDYKEIVFKGFLLARNKTRYKLNCGILIDEYFGKDIIKQAKNKKIILAVSTEKSGQKVFDFEHGQNFGKYLKKVKPSFAKVLVRYDARKNNNLQLKRLKLISDFCLKTKIKFLFELLTPIVKNKADLTAKAIKELQDYGIEPDIWKIEAYIKKTDWEKIINIIHNTRHRKNVGIIMLGRGESIQKVKQWIKIAKQFKQINGFAIGRTIFKKVLEDLCNNKISREKAIKTIADRYLKMIKLWNK